MPFSIIIPLYNRPQEIKELLESLTQQTYTDFEVLVIEDGSAHKAEDIVKSFSSQLNISYYYKTNEGQGFARNFGFSKAKGDFFIFFDSDCVIPSNYLEIVNHYLQQHQLDAYGGPDAAHPSFSPMQKALSYAMTSSLTTGGIRSKAKNAGGKYHPRSYNMGISRKVWEQTGGFHLTNMGEDMDLSRRIHQAGFKIELIADAKVYHKRRTSFYQFWKQVHSFGRTRIQLYKRYPDTLKTVHFLPVVFTLGLAFTVIFNLLALPFAKVCNLFLLIYLLSIFFDSLYINKSLKVAFLSIFASLIQLVAYGMGFIQEFVRKIIFNK
ncbi:glycosyltransferase [Pelobium manganitolerans]|uniref:glycosyltransferase n=1 Tax=Pelobium manganitolerans TaxID=1842495 RepID=UPI003FA3A537